MDTSSAALLGISLKEHSAWALRHLHSSTGQFAAMQKRMGELREEVHRLQQENRAGVGRWGVHACVQ